MSSGHISTRHWRSIWEELSADQRARIQRAVRRGEAVDDSSEATVAAEYAERAKRGVTLGAAVTVVGYSVLLGLVLAVLRPTMTPTTLVLVLTWGVVAVATPLSAWVRIRRFRRSRAANLRKVASP